LKLRVIGVVDATVVFDGKQGQVLLHVCPDLALDGILGLKDLKRLGVKIVCEGAGVPLAMPLSM
jgi:hypothetical protein